jgi:dephospho-CoA kinase
MITIGVTGGLGSGKSTVVRFLARRGAETVDADAVARTALDRGTAAYDAALARFGPEIVTADGSVDRGALARVVFSDPGARADLEAIVHPVVRDAIMARLDELAGSDAVLVLDLPLLVETGGRERYRIDGVLVVDTPIDLAIERVVHDRGLSEADARARIEAQVDPGTRLRAADFIIMNHGTPADLEQMTDGAWRWIDGLRESHRAR